MGYTLYWKMLTVPPALAVRKVLAEIPLIIRMAAIYHQKEIKLSGLDCSEGQDLGPVFNEEEIRFNGYGEEAHEPFHLPFTRPH